MRSLSRFLSSTNGSKLIFYLREQQGLLSFNKYRRKGPYPGVFPQVNIKDSLDFDTS